MYFSRDISRILCRSEDSTDHDSDDTVREVSQTHVAPRRWCDMEHFRSFNFSLRYKSRYQRTLQFIDVKGLLQGLTRPGKAGQWKLITIR